MLLRRSIKAFLVVVVLAVAVAIVFSLLSRSRTLPPPPENDLLPEDVESRGTNFDHSEFKLGKIVFRVRSQIDTVSGQGERLLQDVELLVFGDNGEVADAVTGKEATYWLEQKRIELRREVRIRLADGTEIFSDRVQGDLEQELIHIQEGFTFRRGDASGLGSDLTYRTHGRRLTASRSFQMQLPVPDGRLTVRSTILDYDLSSGSMSLRGAAEIQGDRERLAGQSILLKLTPESRIQHLDATGAARFVSPPHQFSGQRIVIDFDPEGSGVTRFQVLSGATDAGAEVRARYRQQGPRGDHTVESDRMDLFPAPGATSSKEIRLSSFDALGDVRLASRSQHLENSGSDHLRGDFDESGRLREVTMDGNVRLNRLPEGAARQALRAPRVVSVFEQGRLVETRAAGPVSLEMTGQKGARSLQAQRSFRMWYQKGRPTRMEAIGEVQVRMQEESSKSTLSAPQLAASFQNGLLDRLNAGSGVRLVSVDPQSSRQSTSQTLSALFRQGALSEISQSGSFLLVEETSAGKTQLESEQAHFSVASGELTATGEKRGLLTQWDSPGGEPVLTRALTFHILQKDRAIAAEGSVESEFVDPGREEPVRITSQRMEGSESDDWITYVGGTPLLRTRQSRVSGESVRVQRSGGLLEVVGAVESWLTQPAEQGSQEYHVQSERLEIDRGSGKALYSGQVRARSEEMLMKAPFMELLIAPEANDRVREVRAWGGVNIEEPTRIATGDKCFYLPDENLVRLFGNPARVTDEKQGKASGPQLLFYPGKDELVIESGSEKKP